MSRAAAALRRRLAGSSPFDALLALAVMAAVARAQPSHAVSAGLALVAALGLVWPRARRVEPRARRRLERQRTRLVVIAAVASATLAIAADLSRFVSTGNVRVWNVYHYYLGAKYFGELGYTDLYDATLKADSKGLNYWGGLSRVRNLSTYAIEGRRTREQAYEPAEHFEPARWQAFQRDVAALARHLEPHHWQGIFTDRGYNGTPFWTVLGGGLAHLVPADHRLALALLCSLDLLLLGGTLVLIATTFGARKAACVLLLLTLSPVNAHRFVGGFLQYDWFCAVAIALCLYRRRAPTAAAAAMAYAVLTRVFPVLFVLVGAVPMVLRWLRVRGRSSYLLRYRPPRHASRFGVAFVAWCSLGLLISLANGRGAVAWREFATGIGLHSEHHVFGERRVGLKHAFTHRLGSFELGRDNDRRQSYKEQRVVYGLVAAALLAGCAWVSARSRSWDAMLLGLVPIFALIVTSRYYASYLALVPL
ncbi:MAG: hypothetical protein AAF560_10635, partial [Acidobacteriota bacterium]